MWGSAGLSGTAGLSKKITSLTLLLMVSSLISILFVISGYSDREAKAADGGTGDTGTISGTVTDEFGTPLQGIEVYASKSDGTWTIYYAHTDADGNYTVSGLGSGEYSIGFWDPGNDIYIAESYSGTVLLTAGGSVTGIDAVLSMGGTISGTVTNEEGTPLQGVQVNANRHGPNGTGGTAFTDINGNYTVGGLATGDYKIAFYSGYSPIYVDEYYNDQADLASADIITLTAPDSVTGIDASLGMGGSISGTVTNDTGTPLGAAYASACMMDSMGNCNNAGTAIIDGAGNYSFTGLATGDYKLSFGGYDNTIIREYYNDQPDLASADLITVTAPDAVTGIDAVLSVINGSISGTVTGDAGVPVAGILVTAQKPDGSGYSSTYSDANGNYTIGGLTAGDYRVMFLDANGGGYMSEYYDNQSNWSGADLVVVINNHNTPDIDTQLSRGGSISGTVTNDAGEPLAGIHVVAQSLDGNGNGFSSVWSDANGNYTINGLATGDYSVNFQDWLSGGGYLAEYYNNHTDWSSADSVSVTAPENTAGIDAALSPGGSISGTVTNDEGAPMANIQVDAHSQGGSGYGSTYSDSSGNYTIRGLATGDYHVYFRDNYDGYMPEYFSNQADWATADTVTVIAPQNTNGIDAVLSLGGSITGIVTSDDGSPLADIRVVAQKQDGSGYGSAYSDAGGNYTIRGMSTGEYKVGFTDWRGIYAGEYYDNQTDWESVDLVAVTIGENTLGIDAALSLGGSISGTVANDEGASLSGIWVEATMQDNPDGGGIWTAASTDANGNYTIRGLATGDYKVRFGGYGYLTEYYDNQSEWINADTTSVTAGDTVTGIDSVLSICIATKPSLTVAVSNPHWESYADYLDRELTVQTVFSNDGAGIAYGVSMTGAICTNGVTLTSPMPFYIGNLESGTSAEFGARYHIPAGVGSYKAEISGSAIDTCGYYYVYP